MDDFSAYIIGSIADRNSLLRTLERNKSSFKKNKRSESKNPSRSRSVEAGTQKQPHNHDSKSHSRSNSIETELEKKERLKQKLLADLYFSDHSDNENEKPSPKLEDTTTTRPTRKRPRIDYNENKRPPPLYKSATPSTSESTKHKTELTDLHHNAAATSTRPNDTKLENVRLDTSKLANVHDDKDMSQLKSVPEKSRSEPNTKTNVSRVSSVPDLTKEVASSHKVTIHSNNNTERKKPISRQQQQQKPTVVTTEEINNNGEFEDEDLELDEAFVQRLLEHIQPNLLQQNLNNNGGTLAEDNESSTMLTPKGGSTSEEDSTVDLGLGLDLRFIKTPQELSAFQKSLTKEYYKLSQAFCYSRISRIDEMIETVDRCINENKKSFDKFHEQVNATKEILFNPPLPRTRASKRRRTEPEPIEVLDLVIPHDVPKELFPEFFDDLFKAKLESIKVMKQAIKYKLELNELSSDIEKQTVKAQYVASLKENREAARESILREIEQLDKEYYSKLNLNPNESVEDSSRLDQVLNDEASIERRSFITSLIQQKFESSNTNTLSGLADLITEMSDMANGSTAQIIGN
ncbi:hypothetical protein CANARDRAFT_5285 [[Candida] arabinofermentans NRRL YB-2248]|uniref:Uncharacterized protein n=1 Tax=[Candida] arabinofermentans NRRL YB-2248 TaxID=983967 RepID=A0A1E4T8B4_9ASCO|nr:hypothetical protein CANARDRAFT_5285 [[Candida] arabinofermentans NRRL YB-2248]